MNSTVKKIAIFFVALVVGLVASYYTLSYYRSTKEFVVEFENVNSASLEMRTAKGSDIVKENLVSGDSVRINRLSDDYFVSYKATDGYADGEQEIEKFTDSLTIKPVFSDEKLAELYDAEKSAITSALKSKYKDLDELYDIQNDRLYQYGDWFGATLEYKSDSLFNRDSLGLVMQKQDGTWIVASDPPLPSVNPFTDTNIPQPVAESINSQLHP